MSTDNTCCHVSNYRSFLFRFTSHACDILPTDVVSNSEISLSDTHIVVTFDHLDRVFWMGSPF
jgi:hypothetical protein